MYRAFSMLSFVYTANIKPKTSYFLIKIFALNEKIVSVMNVNVLYSRLLPVDRARSREKGQPFCMEQYYRLFTSYRYEQVEHF